MPDDGPLTAEAAFARYEELCDRFPFAEFPEAPVTCSGLLEIADQFDAFILDGFGVLNVGERPIPGAPECVAELRRMGKRLIVLTNAASHTRAHAVKRCHRLGFDFDPEEVVSSREVAVSRLETVAAGARWGAIAAPDDRFEDISADVRHWDGGEFDGILLLSSAAFGWALFGRLRAALLSRPIPVVVANPDLVAPRETGLSREPGYYAHLLADETDIVPIYFGKPFGNAFEDALSRLPGIPLRRIAMVGDTLHTDILGGRAAGLRTVLVEDFGLFAGHCLDRFTSRSGIIPDFRCGNIA